MEEIKTIKQAKEFLNKLLEKPNGATPYESYINTSLAGDFSVDIANIIISKLKIKDETIRR